jgi:hypothetical protein
LRLTIALSIIFRSFRHWLGQVCEWLGSFHINSLKRKTVALRAPPTTSPGVPLREKEKAAAIDPTFCDREEHLGEVLNRLKMGLKKKKD